MSLSDAFRRAAARGEAALIPYVTGGFPSVAASMERLVEADAAGADVLEIGIPFSDPVADGPTIQAASHRALAAGATPSAILDALAATPTRAPRVAMSYLNPLEAGGRERRIAALRRARVDGLIVPDLPLEEAAGWSAALAEAGIDLVLLVAPTSGAGRAARIAAASRGFVYSVNLAGTTGARAALPAGLRDALAALREASPHPVAAGFGVSTPEQVAALSEVADGVVVGSRLVDAIAHGEALTPLIRSLKDATRRMPCSWS